jgi:hypothetical protein
MVKTSLFVLLLMITLAKLGVLPISIVLILFVILKYTYIYIYIYLVIIVFPTFSEVSLQIPSFNGRYYLSYPSLEDVASKSFTIRLVLKPKSETGLIMLNADRTNGKGDFFSLSLREGNVEFMFDCGSGPVVIR